DRLKHNISPSCLGLFDIILEQKNDKQIIKIIIASGNEKPYHLKKKGMSSTGCFIRIGSASEPMPESMIEDLFARRTRNSISKITSNRQDLTFEQLKIYYQSKGLNLNDKFADNLELLTNDGRFNYVAYLMADSNGTSIKVAKYAGLDRVDLIENNEYGYCSLIKASKQVLEKLELENKTAALITSKKRIEQKLWDPIALREVVINAIVHNDYTQELTPTFEIFADRLEITSAGGQQAGINKKDFFKGYSTPVNREIMRIYKDLDMVEQLGSGMPRILASYPQRNFDFSNSFLRISFQAELKNIGGSIGGSIGLTSRQQEIIKLIQQDDKISYRAMAQQLDINESAIKKHLNTLKQQNIIERIGGTRGYWNVKD
ncbi:MAG: winged helix-turn-helix transcriptional regulator, partial [Methylococcales bacterium]|nr:winged helix-turn-helix transcriptional regulator [Methylococcales bacterium]